MFISALSNSSSKDLELFFADAAKFIRSNFVNVEDGDYAERLRQGWRSTISGQSRFRHSPFLKQGPVATEQRGAYAPPDLISLGQEFEGMTVGFLVDTMWQTIRICGLVHDIGHLPMSHSLEGAIERLQKKQPPRPTDGRTQEYDNEHFDIKTITGNEEYTKIIDDQQNIFRGAFGDFFNPEKFKGQLEEFPLHEKRSLYILNLLFRHGIYGFEDPIKPYRRLIYLFAQLVLFSSIHADLDTDDPGYDIEKRAPFFRVIKSIVAGAVDGDRMDYTIRDGYSAGTDVGRFDPHAIIANSVLIRRKGPGNVDEFKVGFFHRALSSIEQFFDQRWQGYKYIIYHRTASRTEACLQELISRLFAFALSNPHSRIFEISRLLTEFGYLSGDGLQKRILPVSQRSLVALDDANLRTMLFKAEEALPDTSAVNSPKDQYEIAAIRSLLQVVLYRDFRHVYDPFKIETLRERVKALVGSNYNSNDFKNVVISLTSEKVRDEYFLKAEQDFSAQCGVKCCMVTDVQKPKVFSVKKPDDEVLILSESPPPGRDTVVKTIQEHSSVLRHMYELYSREFKINCYFIGDNIKSDVEMIESINSFIDRFILSAYNDILGKSSARRGEKRDVLTVN